MDLVRTPLAGVSSDASVIATYAHRFGPSGVQVGVIRHDQKDAPRVYNTDKYDAWENLQDHPSFKSMLSVASTSDNSNLRAFMAENIFLTKRPPDDEHWRAELPTSVRLLLEQRST